MVQGDWCSGTVGEKFRHPVVYRLRIFDTTAAGQLLGIVHKKGRTYCQVDDKQCRHGKNDGVYYMFSL
jgi:hypothetical protein